MKAKITSVASNLGAIHGIRMLSKNGMDPNAGEEFLNALIFSLVLTGLVYGVFKLYDKYCEWKQWF